MVFKLIMLMLLTLSPNWRTAKGTIVGGGIVSVYKPWRKSRFTPNAVYAGTGVKPTERDLVCAHRTLPFGTVLRLQHNPRHKRWAVCVVLDRGPYGFCEQRKDKRKYDRQCPAGYRYIVAVKRRGRVGWYRGVLDATPAVHKLIGSKGWVFVQVEMLKTVRRRRVLRVKP